MRFQRNPVKLMCEASALAILLSGISPAFAQAQDDPAPGLPGEAQNSASSAEESDSEIVVTGTSIRNVVPTGSSVISITNEDVKKTGASTTADLVATVPQLNSFNTAPRASGNGFGSFAPGLRGLPSNATLMLLNGHRAVGASATETTPDFPNVPSLAIERVEIVADGASAIYGSDAVTGVINFITRKSYSGLMAEARYGLADDYDTFNAGVMAGYDWGSGSILAAYQYTENDNITGAERDWRVLDFRPYGGVDTRSFNCPMPNVRIPATGTLNYAAPALLPDTTNFCDSGAVTDLYPASRLHSGFLSARQDVGDRVKLWGEVLYSDRLDQLQAPPPALTVTINNTNPYFEAPPGTGATTSTVLFRSDNLFGSDHVTNRVVTRAGNASAGIDVRLFDDFQLSVYGTYGWSRNIGDQPGFGLNPVALAAAAAGTTADTALDPFGTGTNPAIAAVLTDFGFHTNARQKVRMAAAKIDGPLATLPGGELKIALGAEYREDEWNAVSYQGPNFLGIEALKRDVHSAFGELFIPLFGSGNETTLLRRLEVSLSGRYDDYSDFGSTTNPKIGVNWAPIDDLTLRGTYGTSFRAPGVRELGALVGALYFAAPTAGVVRHDPTRATQVNTIVLLGGNPNLGPEEATTYSLGADFTPSSLPGLRASVTYYDIHYENVIATPVSSQIFTNPTYASLVIRDPSPEQLAALLNNTVSLNLPVPLPEIGNVLMETSGNFGVRDTTGIDFDLKYQRETSFGAITAGIAGNHIIKFDTQLTPNDPIANTLRLGLPDWTLRGTLGVDFGSVNVTTFVNFRDGVINLYNTPTGTAEFESDPYTTVDLRVAWKLPDLGITSNSELSLQINDVFDAEPPFFPGGNGVGGNINPIGRFVALSLRAEL